ncbi:hypothetical protein IKQ26_03505 [bacterium]|nr:hypothetical protein [bacterium]
MNINRISPKIIDSLRKPITHLSNPSNLLPVILLETTVTGGRSIQAYKRGGKTEFRERFTEDAVSAVFWLGGATALNKFGDKIGEKFLNIPANFDGGSDALRTPIKNTAKAMLEKAEQAITPENLRQTEKKLARFKFTKIALSTLISTAFVGFVLPKINQALTRRAIMRDNAKQSKQQISVTGQSTVPAALNSSSKLNQPSFKGVNPTKLANLAHNLENHAIFKLASSDAGILTGRTMNARNADERREVLFRDITSSYFYTINPIVTRKILTHVVPNGKLATINSDTSQSVLKEFSRVVSEHGGSISADKFSEVLLGTMDDSKKAIMDSLPFKDGVISLDVLKKVIKDSDIIERATKMTGLQPEHADLGKVLTQKQVEDVLRNGAITDFKSMFNMHKAQFGDALTNPSKFVSMNKVNNFRDAISTFVDETVKCAKDGQITEDVLKTVDKKNLLRNGAFWAVGFLISALFLSTLIPKAQYWLTERRTGKNEFPGLHDKKLNQKV